MGSPPPRGSRGRASPPRQPRNRQTKGPGDAASASPNLPAASPSPNKGAPRLRPPPGAPALWGAATSGIVQPAGSAPHPIPCPGNSWGPAPPEPRRRAERAERAGAPSRPPAPRGREWRPRRRSLRPRPAPDTHLSASSATCGGDAALRPPSSGRRRAGPRRGRAGPGARSSRAPPPGRPRVPEAGALESFENRMAGAVAAAAAGALAAPRSRARVGEPGRERRRRRERAGRREGPARAVTSGWSGRLRTDPGLDDCQRHRPRRPLPRARAGPPLPHRAQPSPPPPARPAPPPRRLGTPGLPLPRCAGGESPRPVQPLPHGGTRDPARSPTPNFPATLKVGEGSPGLSLLAPHPVPSPGPPCVMREPGPTPTQSQSQTQGGDWNPLPPLPGGDRKPGHHPRGLQGGGEPRPQPACYPPPPPAAQLP